MEKRDSGSLVKAQNLAFVWELAVGHSASFGLKAAVRLGIPDILEQNKESGMTLHEIAQSLQGSTNVQIDYLQRLLNFLAVKRVVEKIALDPDDSDLPPRYRATQFSQLLTSSRFAKVVMVQNEVFTGGWHHIHDFILHGGRTPFERAQGGVSVWQHMKANPELTKLFSEGMGAMSNVTMESVLEIYDGFKHIQGRLADVGGSFGNDIAKIVAAYPQIVGINLELPHVVDAAPQLPGVTHVAGDMFEQIPEASTILLKLILHDFDDEHAKLVLKNCYQALPKGGKVVIVDIIMDPAKEGPFESLKYAFDLVLLALTNGGRERTQAQLINLLTEAGFRKFKIISNPISLTAVVEAQKK